MMRHMSMSLCGFSAIAGSKLKMSNDQLVHIVSFFEFSDFLKHATFHLVPKVDYTFEYTCTIDHVHVQGDQFDIALF